MASSAAPPLSPTTMNTPSSQAAPSPFSSNAPRHRPPSPQYRPARELPFELREQVTIYFEEGLYSQALGLLQNLLVAGYASSRPAFVPPTPHLSLILTLAIHPSLNTRAKRPDLLKASNLAIQYLHTLNRTVSPANIPLSEAFRFSSPSTSASRRAGSNIARRKRSESPVDETAAIDDAIHTDLAWGDSLFAQADDFWQAVGFASNCSVAYPKRWERWRLWLNYMLSVLEDDWALADADDEENDSYERRKDSLLARFISGRESERRIMRAVFADGSSSSMNEFPELWKNETRERREKESSTPRPSKKARINLEEGEFGEKGFLSSSSSSEDEDELPSSPPTSPTSTPPATHSDTTATLSSFPQGSLPLGGPQAVVLRTRLLSLLSTFSTSLPSTFIPLSKLYSLSLDHIRPLALPTFLSLFTPQSLSPFAPDVASSLVQYIARSLLESAAPASSLEELDWDILSSVYAPYAAAGAGAGGVVGENGKVGGCVEALLGMLVREVGLPWQESACQSRRQSQDSQDSEVFKDLVGKEELCEAMKRGCERRLERARKGGRRSRKGEAGAERDWEEERRVELGYLEGAWGRMSAVLGAEEEM